MCVFFPTEDTEKKRPRRTQRFLCELCVFSVNSVEKKAAHSVNLAYYESETLKN